MNVPADINCLVGRSYVTKSGRVCTVKRLGPGAVRVIWTGITGALWDETEADRAEVNEWLRSVVGVPAEDVEVCEDEDKEAEKYAAWKKALEGE